MNVNTTNSYSTSAATNKGMSGLISGMDTESWVEQMLSGTQGKIDKQEQEKQMRREEGRGTTWERQRSRR